MKAKLSRPVQLKRLNRLNDELRHLVSESGALLGEIIRRERGGREYQIIESTRREMVSLRGLSPEKAYLKLNRRFQELNALGREERRAVAHAFSLLLELMNACENAWRTHRLRLKSETEFKSRPRGIVSVLTAHPTEARSPENVEIFHRIQLLLTEAFEADAKGGVGAGWKKIAARLEHELELAWRVPIARNRKPTVEDEAIYLYSIVLKPQTLEAILNANQVVPFYFRSWVGGDKDGHPGVTEKATRKSLNASRIHLYGYALGLLEEIRSTLRLLPTRGEGSRALEKRLRELIKDFRKLRTVGRGDAKRILLVRRHLREFEARYSGFVHAVHPALEKFKRLFKVFPALVIPLELRESSDELMVATQKRGRAIERMLCEVRSLSEGGNPRWYARGMVISMTRDLNDVLAACKLVERAFGRLKLPVIPLFEQAAALEQSEEIVLGMIDTPKIRRAIKSDWNEYLEVMLGYSDSAKEMGVLPSRLAIASAMRKLDRVCRSKKVQPLFFHGAGGSVDRGGGSIEEQTSGWPESALKLYKVTVQGEMVERAFAMAEITHRQMEAVVHQWEHHQAQSAKKVGESRILQDFAARVSGYYQAKIRSGGFLEVVQEATPYSELQKLRIGSRPTKRSGNLSVSSLRAIPWVLCWTQTRTLFPTWWGVGSAWSELSRTEQAKLKSEFRKDPLFRSYIKLLGFTLAKIELPVWRIYLEQSALTPEHARKAYLEFERENRLAHQFFHAVSGEKELLWYRGWLAESIRLRSPMIHPLNLLQIANRDAADVLLTRETVTGIASGMLTTG